jgi:hypothetical protein
MTMGAALGLVAGLALTAQGPKKADFAPAPAPAPAPTPLEANEKIEIWSGDGDLQLLQQRYVEEKTKLDARVAEFKKAHKAEGCELNPKLEWDCAKREKK